MTHDRNPFTDPDEAALWQMLIFRDINAFATCDWPAHAADFLTAEFLGLNANRSPLPSDWSPDFPTLETYQHRWLTAAQTAAAKATPETLRQAHFAASRLIKITIAGDLALCLKRFDGAVDR